MNTEQRIAELKAQVDALEKQYAAEKAAEKNTNPLFYPEENTRYYGVLQSRHCSEGYDFTGGSATFLEEYKYPKLRYPKIRTERQAELIAKGRGELDIWRAMGVGPQDGKKLWLFDPVCFSIRSFTGQNQTDTDINYQWETSDLLAYQTKALALFNTKEEGVKAIESFGGERLLTALRNSWGVE